MNWTQYFLSIAETVKEKSKDGSTKIGAVIVGGNREIISTGYNSFPRGIDDYVAKRQERPEKYYWFSHAETNAIVNAARIGVSTLNSIMYVTCGVPCTDCTRNIINSGIKSIYCKQLCTTTGDLWSEHQKRSVIMLTEAGVTLNFYE